jgi:hypothetical protein
MNEWFSGGQIILYKWSCSRLNAARKREKGKKAKMAHFKRGFFTQP